MSELDSILNDAPEAVAPAAPVAGRVRTAVASGGNSVVIGIGESIEAIYNGFSMVAGKFGESKLHKFTLIAPTSLVVVSKDKDTGVKSEERKSLEPGAVVTTFLKGNGNYMLNTVAEGQDIELKRVEDGVLPKGHKFAGTAVQTFELYA